MLHVEAGICRKCKNASVFTHMFSTQQSIFEASMNIISAQ